MTDRSILSSTRAWLRRQAQQLVNQFDDLWRMLGCGWSFHKSIPQLFMHYSATTVSMRWATVRIVPGTIASVDKLF